jgi:hypothetical protein
VTTKSTASALDHERCQYRTATGRQCALHTLDPESSFCPRHAALQSSDSVDFVEPLTKKACQFLNAQGINYSLASLYDLLASGRISPRRASTLAYISSLLMRSLPAIDSDRHPNAGKDPATIARPAHAAKSGAQLPPLPANNLAVPR